MDHQMSACNLKRNLNAEPRGANSGARVLGLPSDFGDAAAQGNATARSGPNSAKIVAISAEFGRRSAGAGGCSRRRPRAAVCRLAAMPARSLPKPMPLVCKAFCPVRFVARSMRNMASSSEKRLWMRKMPGVVATVSISTPSHPFTFAQDRPTPPSKPSTGDLRRSMKCVGVSESACSRTDRGHPEVRRGWRRNTCTEMGAQGSH